MSEIDSSHCDHRRAAVWTASVSSLWRGVAQRRESSDAMATAAPRIAGATTPGLAYHLHPTEYPHQHRDAPMANDEHVAILKKGVAAWNEWRDQDPKVRVDLTEAYLDRANLSEADLSKANLSKANLSKALLMEAVLMRTDLSEANLSGASLSAAYLHKANLSEANLSGAYLIGAKLYDATLIGAHLEAADLREAHLNGADLSGANLSEADLREADLSKANLSKANLSEADLSKANLSRANLSRAILNGADLRASVLVETDLTDADLTGCRVHGVSAWGLKLEGTKQQNLVITHRDEPEITVDNIEVAQFIYLMLNNQKVREVIDTITSKVVLILGRFTPERKQVLDGLRNELRKRNYLPVMFDFEKPSSQTTDETITLLARMARFVIADLSDAKSILQELRGIVPDLPSVAVQPLILIPQEEPGMFDFIRKYPWVLEPYRYETQKHLLTNLEKSVVDPADAKARELRGLR